MDSALERELNTHYFGCGKLARYFLAKLGDRRDENS